MIKILPARKLVMFQGIGDNFNNLYALSNVLNMQQSYYVP
ncbi:MAG: hypothetical protein ACI9LM_004912 [Alteromonadaceae bacterium]|jgi:hypothetical protein